MVLRAEVEIEESEKRLGGPTVVTEVQRKTVLELAHT